MSDRIAGIAIAAIALFYVIAAGSYGTSFGDPLGPSVFPRMVGIPALLLALSLVIRPGPAPDWARGGRLLRQAAALGVLIGYALLLEPLGFPLASFLAIALLGTLMGAPVRKGALAGLVAAPLLFLLFDRLLGLPLPMIGTLFG